MTDEKIVKAFEELDYSLFKDGADPDEVNGIYKYCVYYEGSLKKGDQKIFYQVIEFVFINEKEDFDEEKLISKIETTGLSFDGGDYGNLKKVNGGDIVKSLTLRFLRPKKRKCIY